MNREHLEQVIGDFQDLRDPAADPELEALKAAILIEDALHIKLSDNDIGPALLDRGVTKDLAIRSEDPA